MGADKAGLLLGNQPLWRRQLEILRATGAQEVLISGPASGPYGDSGVPLVRDQVAGQGPLAGIAGGLRQARWDRLLVLAIDMPLMSSEFLRELVEQSRQAGRSVIPKDQQWYEPLGAVYQRDCLALAEAHLLLSDRSLQHFLRAADQQGLIVDRALSPEELRLFVNLNSPADVAAAGTLRLPGSAD